ncbi:hypothetical protein [Bradyrhizobium sp. USDA 4486]
MTERGAEIPADIKGWFAGCAAATAVLFVCGLVSAVAKGLTLALLFAGLFVGVVHFAFIAMFTAVSAGLLMCGVRKARLELVVPLFVASVRRWAGPGIISSAPSTGTGCSTPPPARLRALLRGIAAEGQWPRRRSAPEALSLRATGVRHFT